MKNKGKKIVIAMLHLKSDGSMDMLQRAKREIDIYESCGVDAVLAENYYGSADDCETILAYLRDTRPKSLYGVNILGDYQRAFALADAYGARFIQIDSVCGHLPPKRDGEYARELIAEKARSAAFVMGGVRFKYQPVLSERSVEEDLHISTLRCDAVVSTGEGTGIDTPSEKLHAFRDALGQFPLIVGAGVTLATVQEKLSIADGVIIGSWLKDGHADHGDVNEAYVRAFMEKVNELRTGVFELQKA